MPNLYYTNSTTDGQWSNLANWNTVPDGSGISPDQIPWTPDGVGGSWYGNYNLVSATNIEVAFINSPLGFNITGSCDLQSVVNNSYIYSGNFTGLYFENNGIINGGNFSGNYSKNYASGIIYGGVFFGIEFKNYGTISNAGFYGLDFANYFHINGGSFYGNYLRNYAGGIIYNGQFNGSNLWNGGSINDGTFNGASCENSGYIYGGYYRGAGFVNYGVIKGGIFEYPAINVSTMINGKTGFSINGGPTLAAYPPSEHGPLASLLNLPWPITI